MSDSRGPIVIRTRPADPVTAEGLRALRGLVSQRQAAAGQVILVPSLPDFLVRSLDPAALGSAEEARAAHAALIRGLEDAEAAAGIPHRPDPVGASVEALEQLLTGIGLTGECSLRLAERLEDLAGNLVGEWLAAALEAGGLDAAGPGAGDSGKGAAVLCLAGASDGDGRAVTRARQHNARCCEFLSGWRGFYSADPRRFPAARLLRRVDYEEAIEIATADTALVDPRALELAREAHMPLAFCDPRDPEGEATRIGPASEDTQARVKAVVTRGETLLVSMETVGMWRQPGFLASAFAAFARHEISIDLVSTSETSVTVSLEGEPPADSDLEALMAELQQFCRAELLRGRVAVSIVGRRIRSILHRLGPAFGLFEEYPVHLLSQAANDLNFTIVTGPEQATRLAGELHRSLVHAVPGDPVLGPTREALRRDHGEAEPAAPMRGWWWRERERLEAIAHEHGPSFVYSLPRVRQAMRELQGLPAVDRVLYAVKANPHPALLTEMARAGFGFECVSPGEIEHLRRELPELDPGRILFTPNFAPRAEYAFGLEAGVQVTLDNLYPLRQWPELFAGAALFLRIDPGRGRGHHRHVQTAGVQSKFGIPRGELDEARALAERAGARIIGLHAHSGSGIRTPGNWRELAGILGAEAVRFPEVQVLDLGGGFGVVEKPGDQALDVADLGETLAEVGRSLSGYRLWLEPGRYLSAPAGVLLARVTQTKGKGRARYVGIETGMNSLIRPALYGAWHGIVNLSRPGAPATETATVVGPVCETGDVLGNDRLLPECREGDVLAILNAGAYGRVMSSHYNQRDPAGELILRD